MDSTELIKRIERLYTAVSSRKGPQSHVTTAERRVKQAAATYLARCPNYRAITPAIATYVELSVGTVKQLGIRKSFRQLLDEEPYFVLKDVNNRCDGFILLDVQQIVQGPSASGNPVTTGNSVFKINSVPPPPNQPSSSSGYVTMQQLLDCVSTRVWHATNPQLHAVRRAIAMHMAQKASAVQMQATGQQVYEITGTNAGPIMLNVLREQFPGQRQFWQNTAHAFADDLYFSTYKSTASECTIQLNISKLLSDVGASAQAAPPPVTPPRPAVQAANQTMQQQATPSPELHAAATFTVAAPQAAGAFSLVADQTPPPPPPKPVWQHVVLPSVQPPPPPTASPWPGTQQAGATTAAIGPPPPPPRAAPGTASAGCVQRLDEDDIAAAQKLPTALLDTGGMQVLLAQQQRPGMVRNVLQLEPQLLPGYSHVIAQPGLLDLAASSNSHSGSAGTTVAGARPTRSQFYISGGSLQCASLQTLANNQAGQRDVLTTQGLLQLCFELKIQHQAAGGWFRSKYDACFNDKQHAGASQVGASCPAASEDSGSLVADDLQVDEAVQSMISLLPNRLHRYLQPYISSQHQPALMEILIDSNDDVKVRLSDKTTITLDIRIDISEALTDLAAAKQRGTQSLAADVHSLQQHTIVGMRAGRSANSLAVSEGNINSNMSRAAGDGTSVPAAAPPGAPKGRKGFFCLFGGRRHTACSDKGNKLCRGSQIWAKSTAARSTTAQAAAFDSGSDGSSCTSTSGLAAACAIGSDNRIGVAGTLHRISAMRDKQGRGVTGLTYRIGRDVRGMAGPLADIMSSCKASLEPSAGVNRRCVLLLGRPGVGKTTLLRNVAYLMSVPAANGGLGMSVVVVDTSNEIAGNSEVRHPCIGAARRMMVRRREDQADVLIEAVQNHTPDVIIVDEIGTRKEVEAAKTIAQRGVQLVATAHGDTLGDLLRNPTLKDLVGGTTSVTIGDAAAKVNSGRKTVTERLGSATFNTLVELRSKQEWCLHLDVERSVDAMLHTGLSEDGICSEQDDCPQQSASSRAAITQVRTINADGRVMVRFESPAAAKQALDAAAVVHKLAERARASA